MKKLLIISAEQFGYQIDFYNWCFYLRKDYNITYIAENMNLPRVKMDGVSEVLINAEIGFIGKLFRFLTAIKKVLKQDRFENIIVTNNQISTIIRILLINKKVIHDIRTIAVFENVLKRKLYDLNWYIGTRIYTHNTVITDKISDFYKIKKNKYSVLPLGANVISNKEKHFDVFHLLYIGVIRKGFNQSIEGFSDFLKIHPNATYTIIGFKDFCDVDTEQELKEAIVDLKLEKSVRFVGRKNHSECVEYFDACNVGVSFIPMLPQFDNQPPTKNFEYLLSGMICIATATNANKSIIKPDTGIVINDNSKSFTDGLIQLHNNRLKFKSNDIRKLYLNNCWEKIVENKMKPVLNEFENVLAP